MEKYLIDNNVVSNYFSESYTEKGMTFIDDVIDQIPNISVITEIKALSWIHKDKQKEKIVTQFVSESNILNITPAIVMQCVNIRRQRKIKTPDAIIAATAIIHGLTLITNDSDFYGVPGLLTIDPFSL